MAEAIRPDEIASRLHSNWKALRPFASRSAVHAGAALRQPTPDLLASLPAAVQRAFADAVPAGGPSMQVVKVSEVMNGSLVLLIDDGTALDEANALQVVVNVVVSRGATASSRTFHLAAVPAATPHAPPAP
jgi:hypothetical protein